MSYASTKIITIMSDDIGYSDVGCYDHKTQDSKDVLNFSPKQAYLSLEAAKKNKRYNPTRKEHGRTDAPIALFNTRSWSRIRSGVLKSIKIPKSAEEPIPKAIIVEDDETP